MGLCKKCYKKEHCGERDQFERCTEYKRIDEIRKEIKDANDNWRRDTCVSTVAGVVRGTAIHAEIRTGYGAEMLRNGLDEDFGDNKA